jgi:hypothetical protein
VRRGYVSVIAHDTELICNSCVNKNVSPSCVYVCVCLRVWVHVHMFVFVCVCGCNYVCICDIYSISLYKTIRIQK